MCTLNMTFEVPDTRTIDLESIKSQIQAFFNKLIELPAEKTMPIVKENKIANDMSFFDRFDNDWSDDPRDSHEIADELHNARVNDRPFIEKW